MAVLRKMFVSALLFSLHSTVGAAVHERLERLPNGWRESDRQVSAETVIRLQVALYICHKERLDMTLQRVSEPDSVDYGMYLTKEDLQTIFFPEDEAVANVTRWLTIGGASSIRRLDNTAVDFDIEVGSANMLLDGKFKRYTDGKNEIVRTMSYSIPDDLKGIIDLVSPTTYFGTPTSAVRASRANLPPNFSGSPTPSCETNVTVRGYQGNLKNTTGFGRNCFRMMYNLGDYQANPMSGSTIGFANFDKQHAKKSDLAIFEKIYHLHPHNFTTTNINNPHRLTLDTEGNLNVQVIVSIADGVSIREYNTGGLAPLIPDALTPALLSSDLNEPYLPYFRRLVNEDDSALPYVITHSYGDNEDTVPERYTRRVCTLIGLLGLRGRTIVFASGDEGPGNACRSNVNNKPAFGPIFPATCPYVTSVGGTAGFKPQYADVQSSGGFSNYFGRAWYQDSAVKHYINNRLDSEVKDYYTPYVNFTGRGFPDLAAFCGWPWFLTIMDGEAYLVTGTSVAAPLVAAVFALLNDARFRAGNPAMGFINPWLYRYANHVMDDIILGLSERCDGDKELFGNQSIKIPYASWNATPGWDPVTGLGIPNFELMKAAALDPA